MAVGEQVRSRRGISDSNTNDRNPEEYYAALSLPWEPFCISRWKDSAFVYNLVALSGHGGDLVRRLGALTWCAVTWCWYGDLVR